MPKQSALRLVDEVAEEAARSGRAPHDLRAQIAFVRALVDEVESYHPADRWIPAIHEQLGDELARLAQILKRGSSGTMAAVEGEPEPTRPVDVLVVDDDEHARRSALAVLRDLGYPCRAARDAEEALREYDREPAAIILTDWSMPGMSGFDLCLTLKRREPQPYVILVTAFAENARFLERGRGHADDFLHKPLDLDELEARLRAASRLIRALRTVSALNERLRGERPITPCAPCA